MTPALQSRVRSEAARAGGKRTHNNANRSDAGAGVPRAGQSTMRLCYICKEQKTLSNFYRLKEGGFTYMCKKCSREKSLAWHKENHARSLAASRSWRSNNPDKARECSRRSKQKAKEKLKHRNLMNSYVRRLDDIYIKERLRRGTMLSGGDFPAELIEAQRALIQIKRVEKEKRKGRRCDICGHFKPVEQVYQTDFTRICLGCAAGILRRLPNPACVEIWKLEKGEAI